MVMDMACRRFLLNISQGNVIRGTERVRGWTSLRLEIVKPQSHRERRLGNIGE